MLGFELLGLKQGKDLLRTFVCLHLHGNAHPDTRSRKLLTSLTERHPKKPTYN